MERRPKGSEPNYRLRNRRRQHGWTLEDAAHELLKLCEDRPRELARGDVNAKMLGSWERGEHQPSFYYQKRLCLLYNASIEELGFLDTNADTALRQSSHLSPHVVSDPQQVRTELSPHRPALDLLLESPPDIDAETLAGIWLALGAGDVAVLFDQGWSVEDILTSLRIVLQGVQAMPKLSRRTFGRKLVQYSAAAVLSGISLPSSDHLSVEEKIELHRTLGDSIAEGWKLFHTASNRQVLAVGQTELAMLQQVHSFLYPQVRSIYYTAIYNLIGRAQHFQERYEEAMLAHMNAYAAALGAGDPLYIAQSLICQADTYQALGHHAESIQVIEEALRCLGQRDEEHLRSRAHLLGCWADNAMMMGNHTLAKQKLDEAALYLEQFSPKEEFDRTSWLQLAGKQALMAGEHGEAVTFLETALADNPSHLLVRHASILIPLAIAYARMEERDTSLRIARQALPVMVTINAAMTNKQFIDYIRQDILGSFPHDTAVHTFLTDTVEQFPQLALLVQ